MTLFSASDDKDQTEMSQNFGLKNVTIYWVGATVLCLWFLFVHAPPFIIERKVYQDIPLATHLGGAYTIYLVCMLNSLFTPSTECGKKFHTIIGKVGMVFGFVSFGLGFYCAWLRRVKPPLGFSIGITIGGVAQVISQIVGWNAIRNHQRYSNEAKEILTKNDDMNQADRTKLQELETKKQASLMTHVYNMVALYIVACGAPALLRLTGIIFADGAGISGLIGSIVLLNLLVKPFGDTYFRKKRS